jgi:hypothetical protein
MLGSQMDRKQLVIRGSLFLDFLCSDFDFDFDLWGGAGLAETNDVNSGMAWHV